MTVTTQPLAAINTQQNCTLHVAQQDRTDTVNRILCPKTLIPWVPQVPKNTVLLLLLLLSDPSQSPLSATRPGHHSHRIPERAGPLLLLYSQGHFLHPPGFSYHTELNK